MKQNCAWVGLLAVLSFAPDVRADARVDYLIRTLHHSDNARTRVQAALALSHVTHDAVAVDALIRALRDKQPAVRAAAASSLQTMGDLRAVEALGPLQRDVDPMVRRAAASSIARLRSLQVPPPRQPAPSQGIQPTHYIAVAKAASKVNVPSRVLERVRNAISEELQQVQGVQIAPDGETLAQATKRLKGQSLVGYHIGSSIVNVTPTNGQDLRVQVSIVISSYPGMSIRAMLSGAATVQGGARDESAAEQAAQAAVQSAIRKWGKTLDAGATASATPTGQ
jgi:hypothetical protein